MAYPWSANDVLSAADLNAAFVDVGISGPASYTPTLVQSGTVTKTVTYAGYSEVGGYVSGWVVLAVTGTGTANNEVRVGLPVNTAAVFGSAPLTIGTGYVFDASASSLYKAIPVISNTAYVTLLDTSTNAGTRLGVTGAGFAAGLASGDLVVMQFSYPV